MRGDRSNPLYQGFTCEKGRQLPEQHYHPERLLTSMARQADGTHAPIASELATAEIAERLRAILDRHGPRAIATYTGTCASRNPAAKPLLTAFMNAIGSPMRFDSNTIDQPGKAVAQALHGMWGAPSQGFLDSDVALLIGINPLVAMSGGVPNPDPRRHLVEAKRRGMTVLVIDPRRTETASLADQHLAPIPGEDIALVAAFLHVIIRNSLYDREFVRDHVVNFDALRIAVRPFTPEVVAARAGVDSIDIETMARTFATAGRGVAVSGTGPGFSGRGSTLLEYLVMVLNTVCGRYLRAGEAVWNPGALLPTVAHKAQAVAPWPAHGYGEKLRVRGLSDAACGLSSAALADEILTPGEGQVRALICLGGNPGAAFPDQHKTWQALNSLDLLVTLDIKMSATAQAAHYTMAPKLTLEIPGSTVVAEIMYYYAVGMGLPRAYAQYTPAIVEPPAGSDLIEEWRFFRDLARHMGLSLGIRPNFPRPDDETWTITDPGEPSLDDVLAFLYRNSRVPLDEIKQSPGGSLFEDDPVLVQRADEAWPGRLDAGNPEMMGELAEAAEAWWPHDDEHPYRIICRRHVGALNSSGLDLPKMRRRPYNPAFMHPDDLAELGLQSGDMVILRARTGELRAVVDADATLRRGLISMTHSYGGVPGTEDRVLELGSNISALLVVDEDFDRITGMPHMSNIPVRVERA